MQTRIFIFSVFLFNSFRCELWAVGQRARTSLVKPASINQIARDRRDRRDRRDPAIPRERRSKTAAKAEGSISFTEV
jgi:hypothetical protein